MTQKKEFMLLFRYAPTGDNQPSPAELNEIQQQWGNFIGNIAI